MDIGIHVKHPVIFVGFCGHLNFFVRFSKKYCDVKFREKYAQWKQSGHLNFSSDFRKNTVIWNFTKNASIGSRVIQCGQTNRGTDMTTLIIALWKHYFSGTGSVAVPRLIIRITVYSAGCDWWSCSHLLDPNACIVLPSESSTVIFNTRPSSMYIKIIIQKPTLWV